MNVYYRGGKVLDYERKEVWDDDWTLETAPPFRKIGVYKFKLHHVRAVDGGFIYDCVEENLEEYICEHCSGQGRHICTECSGNGFIECDFCEGEGLLKPKETERERLNREEKERKRQEFMKNQLNLF
jgi:hypothetical protein